MHFWIRFSLQSVLAHVAIHFFVFPPFLSFDPSRLFFFCLPLTSYGGRRLLYTLLSSSDHISRVLIRHPPPFISSAPFHFIYSSWLDFLRTLVHIPTPVTLDLRRHHVRLITKRNANSELPPYPIQRLLSGSTALPSLVRVGDIEVSSEEWLGARWARCRATGKLCLAGRGMMETEG